MPAFDRISTQFIDDEGNPILNGYLYVGDVGTDPEANPQTIYANASLTVPLSNPQRLDSYGRPENDVYIGVDYSYKVTDSSSVQIELKDVYVDGSGAELVDYLPPGVGAVSSPVSTKLAESISVKDFGALGDNSADDTEAIQAAIDHCATIASASTWLEDDRGTAASKWGPVVELYFPEGIYLITEPLILTSANKNLLITNATLKASGVSWLTTDYMIDSTDGDTTYVTVNNARLNCANKCGGIHARARWRIQNTWVDRVAGYGVTLNGSDAWIDQCIIGQWTTNDAEFYTQANYTGIGIYCPYNDVRITNCTVRWLLECVRVGHTNIFMANNHFFNGMENFASNTDQSTGLAATGRTYAPLLFLENPTGARAGTLNHVSMDHCYLDNGTFELYTNSIRLVDCMFVSNSAHTPAAMDYWFKCYASITNTAVRIEMINPVSWVSSGPRQWFDFVDYDGNTWAQDFTTFQTTTQNTFGYEADGTHFQPNNKIVSLADGRALELRNVGTQCRLSFGDDNTTDDSTRPVIGSNGDDFTIETDDMFVRGKYLAVTNTAGNAVFASRANLGDNPQYQLFEATTDGGGTYSDRGKLWYDNSVNKLVLQSPDGLVLRVNGVDIASFTSTVPTVTGSKGGNAALASLLTALDGLGLINDTST